MRLIKKYPNRRLYDTSTSGYVAMADIKALVLAFEPFRVIDAKTEADLTRATLLQIILEEESVGAPVFSEATLAQVIRLYGHAQQGPLSQLLEQQFTALARVLEQTPGSVHAVQASWQDGMRQFWSAWLPGAAAADKR